MIRVSELLKCVDNTLDRVVIMDHGNIYPYNNKTMPELDRYARRGVNRFYIDIMYIEDKMDIERAIKVKQTMFIELKGDNKK